MATKIRLQRHGRKARPFYHIVIADSRSPRDGKFIEKIGTYDPNTVPATINLDRERAFHWVMVGAEPTNTARAILRYNGVMYRKHLARGVRKGAFSQEAADQMYQDWLGAKADKITGRKERLAAAASTEQAKRDAAERETAKARYGSAEPEDLTKIEGIGPKIAEVLTTAGFANYAALAGADVEALKAILTENSLGSHQPDTWPKQAEMAAAGQWDELKVWQDELDGGKEVEAATEEETPAEETTEEAPVAEETPAEEAKEDAAE